MNHTPNEDLRIIGCTVGANGIVTVQTRDREMNAVLKTKRWANLIHGVGWQFPDQYLTHVARLMLGAGLKLYRIDGTPLPDPEIENREQARTRAILDEIAAARTAARTLEADRARREARAAFHRATNH